MPMSYSSTSDRRQDSRRAVKLPSHIRVVLTSQGHAYVNEDASIENMSEHGALLHLGEIGDDHALALAESPRKCTMLFDSSLPGGLMFLAGEIAWVHLLDKGPCSHAYVGVHLTDTSGRQQSRLSTLLDRVAESG